MAVEQLVLFDDTLSTSSDASLPLAGQKSPETIACRTIPLEARIGIGAFRERMEARRASGESPEKAEVAADHGGEFATGIYISHNGGPYHSGSANA